MMIKTISWKQALPIRHQVLWPNKSPAFCKVAGDEVASHYGAYVNDKLVCVASIYQEGNSVRLRKFATLSDYQGQGIGTQVILKILQDLQTAKVAYFWCDARSSAVGFYQQFGLAQQGEVFLKSKVSYIKMKVRLGSVDFSL